MTTTIGKWIIIVACTVSVVVGLAGNFLIILIRIVNQIKRKNITAYTYLVCQLGVADFLFAFTLVFDIPVFLKNNHWEFGLGLCKFVKMLQSTSLTTTIGFLMLMAYERYLGISNPLGHRWSIKKTTFLSIGIWVYIILTMVPYFLALSISDNECYDVNYSSPNFQKGHILFLFATNYVLPLLFIIFFHTLIVKRLNVHIKKMAPHTNRSIKRKKNEKKPLKQSSSCNLSDSSIRRNNYGNKNGDFTVLNDFTDLNDYNKTHRMSKKNNLFEQKSIFNNNCNDTNISNDVLTINKNSTPSQKNNNTIINKNNNTTSQKNNNSTSHKNNNTTSVKNCEISYSDNVFQKDDLTYNNCTKKKIKSSILSSFSKSLFCKKKHTTSNNKVIRMLLAVTLCFSLMTLPTQIWQIWDTFSLEGNTIKSEKLYVIEVFTSLTYLHCCSNCIIYSVMDQRFRKDVSALVMSVFRKKLRSSTFYSRVSTTFSHMSIKRLYSNGAQNEYKEQLVVIEKETVLD
ncbi:dopamine receptor 4 [Hydra vulgaris]|uniref:Dopamine receptor 4 n=1 Tax=Hydra vulgaris TaxID=6087 RepID=A0ABM4CIK0_HYDVU